MALGPHAGTPTRLPRWGPRLKARTDADAAPSALLGQRRRMAAGASDSSRLWVLTRP